MATAPKANSKVVPIDEGKADGAKKSKKKLMLLVGGIVLVALGAGGAWYFVSNKAPAASAPVKHEPAKPPVFLPMDPFTVNLQPEIGEQYLQVAFTLQLADETQVEAIKLYMPLVRSRILTLLTMKKASEISTAEGKKQLQDDIIAQLKQPFTPQGAPTQVTGVFFTSFVIQ